MGLEFSFSAIPAEAKIGQHIPCLHFQKAQRRIFPLRFRWHRDRTVATGGDYTKPTSPIGTAAWSEDGGKHVDRLPKPPHGYRSTVQWSEPLKAWFTAGTNGSDISRDDEYLPGCSHSTTAIRNALSLPLSSN